ncbi:MAG: 4-(cytidine 5'-diphospho)-2-C-methyl-D-erythritol kinase [Prevotellaceae bacterium]|jgi:4-diphosphocytidyl-2-C-methyl-D-erythritol kinase|nr:4-(cytidine 5'-diphospho)-2-C-methyl-D-erythritol kinase [Prevotellaceae bacterium]
MIVFPNAKINLGLDVIEKRCDGFHNIETVFYPIPLCDILEIEESHNNTSALFNSGIIINDDTYNNLCMKSLCLMKKHFSIPEVNIFLYKKIPFGAGLGGGSADAANVLMMLNKMFSLNIDDEKLMLYAAQIGSDCAFFIKNKPQAASGKGEIMNDININLNGYYLVVVKPDIFVSTAQAYANVTPKKPTLRIADIVSKPIEEWKYFLKNDFETTVFLQFPEIQQIKETLYQKGAIYASMSGTGSSVYGIFADSIDTNDFAKEYFVELLIC